MGTCAMKSNSRAVLITVLIGTAGAAYATQPPDVVTSDGSQNTAMGTDALLNFSSGSGGNTASGFDALYSTTTGIENTASGNSALYSNTTGSLNTATGYWTLYSNTTA